ncbi:MAG: dUTP diphosphatase [bacterium]|nr:dUTP diphosphatase [bacterium]
MEKVIICTYDQQFLPEKKTPGAVCRDLKIAQPITIKPQEVVLVGTGVKTVLPLGRHAKMYARSGLPIKSGLQLANSVAVLDSDYRGEWLIQLYNITQETKIFEAGSRLTQFEIVPTYTVSTSRELPEINYLVDQETYDQFDTLFPSQRGE